MQRFQFKWCWYDVVWLALLCSVLGLAVLTAIAALGEHEYRALWISAGAAILLIVAVASGIVCKQRGLLEGVNARRARLGGLIAIALFANSLLVRSDYSVGSKDIRTHSVGHQEYDATNQAGNEVLEKLERTVDADTLTLSIYDVCVGKLSQKVHRDGSAAAERVEVTNARILTDKIKADALDLGANAVGVTELDSRFILTKDNAGNPVHLTHKYAIVIGKGLNYRLASPTAPLPWQDQYSALPEEVAAALSGNAITGIGKYSPEQVSDVRDALEFFHDGGRIAVELAAQIRSYGYPARAHFGRWSEVQVLPLAVEAGLGEVARNGMLVNPEFGPRGSFPIVTTDLPLIPDHQQDFGIQEFCRLCNKCARACPVQAIPTGGPTLIGGLLRWPLDGQRCWSFIKDTPKCMACMGACPYNKKDFPIHRLAGWLIARKSVVANWVLVRLDDALGYGQSALSFSERFRVGGADQPDVKSN